MSPITHALTGWLISQPLKARRDRVLVTALSIVPDVDGLALIGGVDVYQKYHHTFSHNIFAAFICATLCYFFAADKAKSFLIGLVSFHAHLLEDLLGSGADWGIPYFWPLSSQLTAFAPPFQWELDAWQNGLTTFICLLLIFWCGVRKQRTIVEVFSPIADQKIVFVLNTRLLQLKRLRSKVPSIRSKKVR